MIRPTGAAREFLSSPAEKNISVFQKPRMTYGSPVSYPVRGALRHRHETLGARCGGRFGSMANDLEADDEAVWSWRPDAGAKFATMFRILAGDGDKKARSHRGDHGVSRKPSRREGRIVSADL